MNKKILYIFLLTSISFSNSIKLSSDIDGKFLDDDKIKQNLKLDLNINPIKDLDIDLSLNSKRDNVYKSDYNEEKKEKSHDLVGKFNISYSKEILNNLKINSKFTYYLGNPFDKYNQEYIENDEKKEDVNNNYIYLQLLGDINGINSDISMEYKSKNIYSFDNNESYFKLNTKLNKDKFNFLYNFNIDLDLLNRKFSPLTIDEEDEIAEHFQNKYITKINQELNTNYEKNNFLVDFNLKNTNYLAKREKTDKNYIISQYDLNPSLKLGYNYEKIGIKFTPYLKQDINLSYTSIENDFGENKNFLNAEYLPFIGFELGYKNNVSNVDIDLKSNLEYSPSIVFSPYVISKDNINSNINANFDFLLKYDKLNVSLKNEIKSTFNGNKINKINTNLIYDINYEKNINDLTIYSKIHNKLNINTRKNSTKIDNLKNNLSLTLSTNYEKNNLVQNNELKYENNLEYDYVIDTYNNKEKGRFYLKENLNSIILNNDLLYKFNFDKFDILTGINISSKLDTLVVTDDKIELKKDDKFYLIPSNSLVTNINVGGNIKILPSVGIDFKLLDNLTLKSNLGIGVLFEKNILNKVDDKNRIDNKLYSNIDKDFKFKNILTELKMLIKYEW